MSFSIHTMARRREDVPTQWEITPLNNACRIDQTTWPLSHESVVNLEPDSFEIYNVSVTVIVEVFS